MSRNFRIAIPYPCQKFMLPPGHRGGSCQHRGVVVDVSSRSGISIFTGHGSTTDGLRTHGSLVGPVP